MDGRGSCENLKDYIVIASDHAGFSLKEHLKKVLVNLGYEVKDLGTYTSQSVDYPDYASLLAGGVSRGEYPRGILVCGTGIGMCMVANKFRGVRAALCWDEYTAKVSRTHNDSNVLCLGGRVLSFEEAEKILKIWLREKFEGGRHARRLEKLKAIERSMEKWVNG